jgi:phosphoglycolate phosphatase-like HAD superfamily hydrolase
VLSRRVLRGAVWSGRREAAGFLGVPWVVAALGEVLGKPPYPGTLNLVLEDADARSRWKEIRRSGTGRSLQPPDGSTFCDADTFPVRVNGEVAGAIVLPHVPDYPPHLVEVVAGANLRERLGLAEGDVCRLLLGQDFGPRFACVLFDLEGTLVDFQWQLEAAESELRAAVGGLGFDTTLFAADNYAAIRHRALELAGSAELRAEVDRRLGPIYDRYDLDALSRWSLRPGARQLLGDLQVCGVRVGVVSNIGRRAVRGALEKFALGDAFDVVVTRNEARRMKPEGDGLCQAMEHLNSIPEQTLMVGDSLSDLGAARNAGVAIAIVAGGESSADAIAAARPDHVLRELLEVEDLV